MFELDAVGSRHDLEASASGTRNASAMQDRAAIEFRDPRGPVAGERDRRLLVLSIPDLLRDGFTSGLT